MIGSVIPDFFSLFTLFGHFAKLSFPQIRFYVIYALKMCTAKNPLWIIKKSAFSFADFVILLIMKLMISD